MAAALLVGLYDNEDEEHHDSNLRAERLLRPHDVLHFPDHILISFHRLPRNLNLVEEFHPALEMPTLRHRALPVIVQVTNALCFFFAKGDF